MKVIKNIEIGIKNDILNLFIFNYINFKFEIILKLNLIYNNINL